MPQAPTSSQKSTTTPDLETALADLPPRVRVHDLARRAGLNSKQAIAALTDAGVEVASASSSVDREVAESLLTNLLSGGESASTTGRKRSRRASGATRGKRSGATGGAHEDTSAGTGRDAKAGTNAADAKAGTDSAASPAPSTDSAASTTASAAEQASSDTPGSDGEDSAAGQAEGDGGKPRRRRRGGRGRRGSGKGQPKDGADSTEDAAPDTDATAAGAGAGGQDDAPDADKSETEAESDRSATDGDSETSETPDSDGSEKSSSRRRRRRRRRSGSSDGGTDSDADATVHVREGRSESSSVQGVKGSTRLEAKRQRRRDSRGSRRRPQILSEAEFLARRESVDRVMAVRQHGDLAQVALLEDGVLVEHFVSRSGSASMIGNVYLGRVQNVLPSMEAAFVDIGKGRNAVLYAGEVNWDIAGLEGKERRIETALSSGDTLLVQVSKDPIGHKGARLTTQISLPGRFLVYVPGGGATGISRKLPDTERKRLKGILDRIVPAGAGVIIRTAAEGVGEQELAGDVARLQAQWEEISAAAESSKSSAPTQLYAEPDTLIKVIRDLFNSDINRLLIDGDEAWTSVSDYVLSVAPELADRVSRYVGEKDVFAAFRIDEQISKALQRKVHLPSGGSLVIDRTEAMTVIDVNTGKFTGSGGNLEETVTRNNIEAAEEIVRQLRLRDIGGIIVVDFIDMVLESNRELVLRRLTECLGRDRTRHQVAEVTSLGLVQMTRKRMGIGLVEAFSEPCSQCGGRGIVLHDTPADTGAAESDGAGGSDRARRKGRKRGRHGRDDSDDGAKYEPLVVDRVTADAKPDPRGPKPPALFRSEQVSATEQDVPDGGDGGAGGDGDREQPPVDGDGDAGAEPAQAPPSAPTAPAAPRRRRRAAGRPAGAPESVTAAVDLVLPAGSGATDSAPAPEPAAAPEPAVAPEPAASEPAVAAAPKPRRRRAASRAAGPVTASSPSDGDTGPAAPAETVGAAPAGDSRGA